MMKPYRQIVQQNKDLAQAKLHRIYLIFLFIVVALVSGKSVFASRYDNSVYTDYQFPREILFDGWRLSQSKALNSRVKTEPSKYDSIHAGREYQYTQNYIPLKIEMRYVVATLGNVPYLTSRETSIETEPIAAKLIQEKHLKGSGFVGHYTYQDRAYLSSCINPQGESTVTGGQFAQNRRKYDLKLDRFLPIFLGSESLQDRRCLWVLMSIPLEKTSPDQAYQSLEKAWIPWFQWWSSNFPRL